MNDHQEDRTVLRQIMRRRLRPYYEQLYEDSRLREALTDSQAGRLLAWGAAQLEVDARLTLALPDVEAEERLEGAALTVRRLLRRVNRLVALGDSAESASLDDRRAAVIDLLRCRYALTNETPTADQVANAEQLAESCLTMPPTQRFEALWALLQPPTAAPVVEQQEPPHEE